MYFKYCEKEHFLTNTVTIVLTLQVLVFIVFITRVSCHRVGYQEWAGSLVCFYTRQIAVQTADLLILLSLLQLVASFLHH